MANQNPANLAPGNSQKLQLQDIHLPGSASFWPPAPGWWLLLALLIFITIWAVIKLRKKARLKKQQNLILAQLDALEADLKKHPSNETIAEINTLLRQLAVNYYPRDEIASLTGAQWLQFLDSAGGTRAFSKGAGRILVDAPYQASDLTNLNLDEFVPLVRKWVRKIVKNGGGVS